MTFACVIIFALVHATVGQTTHDPGEVKDSVSELKDMVRALQQQVSAIHSTLLTQQTLSIDQICRNITSSLAVQDPKDCEDVLKAGNSQSGIYTVKPPNEQTGVQVYCDMDTAGGGWLLIQKRIDGKVDFHRTFSEYEAGFGNLSAEHWLGNKHIHAITSSGNYELLVELEDFQQHIKTAHYSSFSVGDSGSVYRLSVSGYNGTAGDSLMFDHNGHQFSTYDADHDGSTNSNCAASLTGGYWYSNCFKSNLNGKWGVGGQTGIVWGSFKDWQMYVLKRTEMKIRPRRS